MLKATEVRQDMVMKGVWSTTTRNVIEVTPNSPFLAMIGIMNEPMIEDMMITIEMAADTHLGVQKSEMLVITVVVTLLGVMIALPLLMMVANLVRMRSYLPCLKVALVSGRRVGCHEARQEKESLGLS